MSDSERYLLALLEGNSNVIEEIYTLFFPKVKFFVIENKGKEIDAKDVFQDALLYLIIVQKEKELQVKSFEAYLFTICKNIWRRKLKNKKEWVINHEVIPLIDRETDLSLFILEQKRLEFYQEKFQLLSDNCKQILGNYFNGMKYEEILIELNYSSINTVRQRVFKCKTKIIKLIKSDIRYKKLSE